MDLDLQGKVIIVTGPTRGLGPAITMAFAREGCKLVLASRDIEAIEAIAMKTESDGGAALPVRCDITSPTETDRMAELAVKRFGQIDGLINVASDTGPIGDATWNTSPAEFEHTMQVNLLGCFNTMRAVLPRMIARRYGKIVNVGGTYGMRARAGRMAYSTSKWGLRGLTKSAAIEAGQHNVNVNLVAPGMVDDERFRSKWIPEAMSKYGLNEEQAELRHAEEYAMRRITTMNDVANACLFLASDASRQITGVDLPVDGGWASL
ncbi:SDR family NAD(P)-dependent oxidoreductase [Methyloversatilis thermotolerans]|jgi:3-oxoacyl-[acyl-carrier protein] reductase|uniref:SDR family NAD(P)-dependent oxidoreductase n=1 Tax=Methyloversatilis thermotolerans TaxID=1346290 RepID=UPI00037D9265|nr:SDR family NAD(P)-dependent oxidoreductase [Methyloversatilis thermotolerans]